MKQAQVFISYSSAEVEAAHWLRRVLETNGISTWIAPDDMVGGASYATTIPQAIRGCEVFVVILSKSAQASQWVPKELDQAINAKKVIMPFMIEDCVLRDDFNFYLSNVHRYAAYENKLQAAEKMVREIQAILDVRRGDSQPQQTDEPQRTDEPRSPSPEAPAPDPAPVIIREPEPEKPADETGEKKKRGLLWAALGIGAALLIALAVFLVPRLGGAGAEKSALMHITLTAPDEMNVREFNESLDILTERLDIFFGRKTYRMDVQEDTIELFLPESGFAGIEPENVLRCYLTREMRLYFADVSQMRGDYVALPREALESVERLHGVLEGVDVSDLKVDPEGYDYFHITLTQDYIDENGKEIASWDKSAIAQDVEDNDIWFYYHTFPGESDREFYLINDDIDDHFQNTMEYNLTHDPSPDAFYFTVDLNSKADWNTPETARIWGENQTDPDSVGDNCVTVLMKAYSDMTEGEWLDTEKAMKARLDTLGCPYAFGEALTPQEGYSRVLIRLPADHYSAAVAELVGNAYSMALKTSLAQTGISSGSQELTLRETDGTADAVLLNPGEEALQILRKIGADAQDPSVLLCMGDFGPMLRAELDRDTNGALVFDQTCQIRDGKMEFDPITADQDWFLRLLEAVWNGSDLPNEFSVEEYQYDSTEDAPEPILSVDYSNEDLKKRIEALGDDITCRFSDKGTLGVLLNLPVDEKLPAESLRLSEEIFRMVLEENTCLSSVTVYFIDEDDSVMERGRAYLQTNVNSIYFSDETHEDGYRYIDGIFTNGRLDDLQDAFREQLENNEFFRKYDHSDQKEYYRWEYSL